MSERRPEALKPMHASLRCGAKTRSGKPCASPAVSGKKRCRMHGGALGSGAPRGNQNALKHGKYTRAAINQRREVRNLIRFLSKHPFDTSWDDVELPEMPYTMEAEHGEAGRRAAEVIRAYRKQQKDSAG